MGDSEPSKPAGDWLAEIPAAPDYCGSGIVNLVSSLAVGLGGSALHPECAALTGAEISRYRNVVLLLVDGLGFEFLQRQQPNVIADGLHARLTSVFPSTTASAITSYLTGMSPYEHGLTGWYTFLRELGSVATVLPFRPRLGGPAFSAAGIDPLQIFHWPSVFERMEATCAAVTPHYIADSDYSRATTAGARRFPYRDLKGYFAAIHDALQMPASRRYVYAYWPELDSLCHRHGTRSDAAVFHFADLGAELDRFLDTAADGNTLILMCADHGHIDTAPEFTLEIEQHPELSQCLSLPLCGEPRAAFCYVHTDAARRFERFVRDELADQCVLVNRSELLASGLLGTGSAHSEIHQRVGDYLILMRDRWVIRDRLPGEQKVVQVGVHGGVSTEEMHVPLIRFEI